MPSVYRHYLFASLFFLLLLTSISAQSSCIPLNCVAQCQPNCLDADVCILATMSTCGQCPASKCVSPKVLGISTPTNNNSFPATPSHSEQQDDSNNNSSLIGGLVGGLVGGGLLIGISAFCIYRSRGRNAGASGSHQQPQQQRQLSSSVDNKFIQYPSLSDMPRSLFDTSRDSTCHSITSGVIPVAYIPPSNEMQPSIDPPYINSTTTITIDNPFQDPRHSLCIPTIGSGNNNYIDDIEDDRSSQHQSILDTDQHTSHYAIQVTRAKPHILRVSSLKRNGSAPSLSTKQASQGREVLTRSNTFDLASALSSRDPFQNNSNPTVDGDENDNLGSSRPSTNHSLGSTLGDGEITIFWHGQQ